VTPFWEFRFADSIVILRPDSGDLFILNSSAAYAWHLLCSGKSLGDAIDEFAARFEIPADIAARDLKLTWSGWEQTLLAPISQAVSHVSPLPPAAASPGSFSRDYRLHGRTVRVTLHHPDLIAEIALRLEPLLASPTHRPDPTLQATASENGYHIFSGAACVATEEHPANARVVFLQEFVRTTQPGREWTAILHAAACGSESKCVIFPAATHAGKTTLAAVLMHEGLTLYADDSVALCRESLGIPVMPFALMLREGSWPVLAPRFSELDRLPGYNRNGQNVKFLHPIHPAHSANASAVAIVRLKESGFWVAHDRYRIQDFLDWIQSLPVYEMIYSDLDEATAFIKTLLDS
jgi:hypothetical protein